MQPGDPKEPDEPDQDSEDDPEEVQQLKEQPQSNQVIEDEILTQVSEGRGRSHERECWNCLEISSHYASYCPHPRRRRSSQKVGCECIACLERGGMCIQEGKDKEELPVLHMDKSSGEMDPGSKIQRRQGP